MLIPKTFYLETENNVAVNGGETPGPEGSLKAARLCPSR